MSGFGFQIGQPNKKYGLIKPETVVKPKPSIFSADDEEQVDIREQLRREAERKKNLSKVREFFKKLQIILMKK